MKLIKSTSMRSMFKVCPRLIYFRYVAGIRKKETIGPRFIGKLYHEGLQEMRLNKEFIEIAENVKKRMSDWAETNRAELEMIKIFVYLKGYRIAFTSDWQYPIETEKELSLGDEIGYIDACLVHEDGSISIIEDKTAASLVEDQEAALVMNDQLLNYIDLCEQSNISVKDVRYRETQKSLHQKGKAESWDQFRLRLEDMYILNAEKYRETIFVKNNRDLKRFRMDKLNLNKQIDDLVHQNLFKPFDIWPCNGAACIGKFGACDFLPICGRSKIWVKDLFEMNGKDPIDEYDFIDSHKLRACDSNLNNPFQEVTND